MLLRCSASRSDTRRLRSSARHIARRAAIDRRSALRRSPSNRGGNHTTRHTPRSRRPIPRYTPRRRRGPRNRSPGTAVPRGSARWGCRRRRSASSRRRCCPRDSRRWCSRARRRAAARSAASRNGSTVRSRSRRAAHIPGRMRSASIPSSGRSRRQRFRRSSCPWVRHRSPARRDRSSDRHRRSRSAYLPGRTYTR